LPVVRNTRSQPAVGHGQTFAIAWLGVRASVAYTCWYSAEIASGSRIDPQLALDADIP
jgi:hypothetical protein